MRVADSAPLQGSLEAACVQQRSNPLPADRQDLGRNG